MAFLALGFGPSLARKNSEIAQKPFRDQDKH
jgi:hypothetical protein